MKGPQREIRNRRRLQFARGEYYRLVAEAFEAKAVLVEARRTLGETERRERKRLHGAELQDLTNELQAGNVPFMEALSTLELTSDPDKLRQESERFKVLSKEAAG